MTTAPRSFRRAVEKKKNQARPTVVFNLDTVDDEGEVTQSDTFHATQPTEESLFLLAAMAGDEESGGAEEAAAIMDFFRQSLPEEEYRTLRKRLRDPESDVSLDVLQEVIPWLMEEWTSFPTEPASVSSRSQGTTGARSTGRVRGKGSVPSTSN
jgi:hypothetical protein